MSSARKLASLIACCALLCGAGLSQTACTPKNSNIPEVSAAFPEEAADISDSLDSFVIDRELYLAATTPSALVASSSLSVSELEEHRALYGNALELTSEPVSLSVPSGMLQFGSEPGSVGQWSIGVPAPGSAEERSLAEMNTKASLCEAGETVCITSPYGVRRSSRRSHKGIDIRAPLGSPIMAFRGGVVVCAQYHRTYGYMVDIQQDDGLLARYAHMSQIIANKGDRVEQGLMIGRVGSTGRSTGPHLHFELLRDNRQMNPMVYLPTPKQVVTKGTEEDAAAARKALAKSGHAKKKTVAKKTSQRTTTKKTAVKKTSTTKKTSTAKKTSTKTATKKTSTAKNTASKSSAAKTKTVADTSKK